VVAPPQRPGPGQRGFAKITERPPGCVLASATPADPQLAIGAQRHQNQAEEQAGFPRHISPTHKKTHPGVGRDVHFGKNQRCD
jgi:hypothetical protein